MATRVFYIYRYQILPINVQPNLLYDLDSLIAKKNQYFYKAVLSLNRMDNKGKKRHGYELIKYLSDFVLLIASRQKRVGYIREDHVRDDVESYPFGHIIIDNDDKYQIMCIEDATELRARSIAKKIEKSLHDILSKDNLTVKISPLYKERDFWSFVESHKGKITKISFDLITPNMSNISSRLSEDLKNTAKMTGTTETNLKLNAARNGFLNLERRNTEIDGLVDYASKGGGEIRIAIKDAKIGYHSNDAQINIEIGELELKGNLQELVNTIRIKADDGNNW